MRKGVGKSITEQELKLVEEVMGVAGSEVFIFLDLFLFSALLGIILFNTMKTWVYFTLIPLCFFIIFAGIYKWVRVK